MVHQEKRVYQVCGLDFACFGDIDGFSWQVSIMLMKQPQQMRDHLVACACSNVMFTSFYLGIFTCP